MRLRPGRVTRRTLAAACVTCALGVGGCSSHRAHAPAPASSTPSRTPASSAASASAGAALQHDAASAQAASFSATYRAQEQDPPRSGTVRVYRTPTRARLDVETGGTTVRIIVNEKGTFSCKLASGSAALCVTLAGPQERVPATLDPGLQHLFTSALDVLAAGNEVTVAPDVTRQTIAGYPASCYSVTSAPPDGDVSPGEYCFTAGGLLAEAGFRSGTLTLESIGSAPTGADFTLPASPAPLSSGSPTPTATAP